jgi:hypothetical protein
VSKAKGFCSKTAEHTSSSTYSMHGERQGLGLVCRGRPRLSYATRGALQMGGVHRALTQTTARAHPMASAHIAALVLRGDIDKSVQFCTDGTNIASLAFRFGLLAPGFLRHPQNLPGVFLPKPTPLLTPRLNWSMVWARK